MERKTYPQREYSEISTSTILSCSGCQREIAMFEKCFTDGQGKYYHGSCKPADNPEVKGGVGPSTDSGEKEDG